MPLPNEPAGSIVQRHFMRGYWIVATSLLTFLRGMGLDPRTRYTLPEHESFQAAQLELLVLQASLADSSARGAQRIRFANETGAPISSTEAIAKLAQLAKPVSCLAHQGEDGSMVVSCMGALSDEQRGFHQSVLIGMAHHFSTEPIAGSYVL